MVGFLIKASRRLKAKLKAVLGVGYFKAKYPGVELVFGRKVTFFSQSGQDAYVASLLVRCLSHSNTFKGVIDVGANHPVYLSNTYFFEKWLGCEVLAVDPVNSYKDQWKAERPRARLVDCAAGSDQKTAILSVPVGDENGMIGNDFSDMYSSLSAAGKLDDSGLKREKTVAVKRLSVIMEESGFDSALYCSIDVEGYEMEVLKGIDFCRHDIVCFSIENNNNGFLGDERLRKFMRDNGYRFVARIWGLDDIFVKESYYCGDSVGYDRGGVKC